MPFTLAKGFGCARIGRQSVSGYPPEIFPFLGSSRLAETIDDSIEKAKTFQRRNPALASAAVVAAAALVGGIVWGFVRLYTR